MAKSKQTFDFFEPWKAEARRLDLGEPVVDGLTEEQAILAMDARRRAQENAGWIVWGSRMVESQVSTSLLGKRSVFDDKHIVVHVRNPVMSENNVNSGLGAKDVATRIAECVTAFRGVKSPASFMDRLREVLLNASSHYPEAGELYEQVREAD